MSGSSKGTDGKGRDRFILIDTGIVHNWWRVSRCILLSKLDVLGYSVHYLCGKTSTPLTLDLLTGVGVSMFTVSVLSLGPSNKRVWHENRDTIRRPQIWDPLFFFSYLFDLRAVTSESLGSRVLWVLKLYFNYFHRISVTIKCKCTTK